MTRLIKDSKSKQSPLCGLFLQEEQSGHTETSVFAELKTVTNSQTFIDRAERSHNTSIQAADKYWLEPVLCDLTRDKVNLSQDSVAKVTLIQILLF